jgi:hypothetical protein
MKRISLFISFLGAVCSLQAAAPSEAPHALPVIAGIEAQPLVAQARRHLEALELLGAPLAPADQQRLRAAFGLEDEAQTVRIIQEVLDPYCLAGVNINPESRVKVTQGPAPPILDQGGWRVFLVKAHNEAGVTAELVALSPNAQTPFASDWVRTPSDRYYQEKPGSRHPRDLWLDLDMFNSQPLTRTLSGFLLEYRLIQLYSRDAGKREAKIEFHVGQGTQDLGFRNEVDILFTCRPGREIQLEVKDEHGNPAMACFVIRDGQGRVYPSRFRRLAPDFAFHPQVYRGDGETVHLPDGKYSIEFSRGPESIPEMRDVTVNGDGQVFSFQVRRWIDPAQGGWWSGDHHIHAAGCAHYTDPTQGVHAQDMLRHCMGEDLKIGANLTWGPCFDYQKQFFTGEVDKVSQYPYLIRYDIEVSGFGSHQSGHLCLLSLQEQMYPGGDSKDHWPTLGLNTLRWAKSQGAVTGPAHSGWGLEVKTSDLPNYIIPPYNGIGANEYIMNVTHEVPGPDGQLVPAVDFISMVDTPHVWELNMWYHTLNAGFRTRISGETDFPCIYGERVGLGRSYVKLDGPLDYDAWCQGIRQGRSYVGDGRSHLLEMRVNDVAMGENGSELRLDAPGVARVFVQAAARLGETPDLEIARRHYAQQPYWHIERARIGDSRQVPVELVVNGYPAAREIIEADGRLRDLTFNIPIERSSWVAVRILPSSHTNPVFVLVEGKPIRASRRSIEWCLAGVDQCWMEKQRFYHPDEMEEARRAYEHARQVYRRRLAEAEPQ